MIQRHQQLFRHNPEQGIYGDCFRTVVACILHLQPEEVPHVFDGTDDANGYDRMRQFLAERGCLILGFSYGSDVSLSEVLAAGKIWSCGAPYLLTGRSRNEVNHVVICINDEIVHDTSIDQSGIVGPTLDGQWIVEWIVRPVHPVEVAA